MSLDFPLKQIWTKKQICLGGIFVKRVDIAKIREALLVIILHIMWQKGIINHLSNIKTEEEESRYEKRYFTYF